ncbi:hypothetical protein ACTFIZ_002303 [Dictyostelium cf. discoideum]
MIPKSIQQAFMNIPNPDYNNIRNSINYINAASTIKNSQSQKPNAWCTTPDVPTSLTAPSFTSTTVSFSSCLNNKHTMDKMVALFTIEIFNTPNNNSPEFLEMIELVSTAMKTTP